MAVIKGDRGKEGRKEAKQIWNLKGRDLEWRIRTRLTYCWPFRPRRTLHQHSLKHTSTKIIKHRKNPHSYLMASFISTSTCTSLTPWRCTQKSGSTHTELQFKFKPERVPTFFKSSLNKRTFLPVISLVLTINPYKAGAAAERKRCPRVPITEL